MVHMRQCTSRKGQKPAHQPPVRLSGFWNSHFFLLFSAKTAFYQPDRLSSNLCVCHRLRWLIPPAVTSSRAPFIVARHRNLPSNNCAIAIHRLCDRRIHGQTSVCQRVKRSRKKIINESIACVSWLKPQQCLTVSLFKVANRGHLCYSNSCIEITS